MCGRYNITSQPLTRVLMDLVGMDWQGDDRLNLAPTQQAPVLRRSEAGEHALDDMRWWLVPFWSKEPSTRYAMFNARAENIAKSAAFREPFARRRCVVPISGFYEWVKEEGGKQPMYVERTDGTGLALAGIWDRWRGDDDTDLLSFAIVTTAVHPDLAFLHHRQPVLLDQGAADAWLAPDTPRDTLDDLMQARLPHDLQVTPMSTYVNNARNKGEECLAARGNPRFVAAAS